MGRSECPGSRSVTPARLPDLSHQPDYEVRTASLDVGDTAVVTVWWAHVYANTQVDILAITLL